MFKQSFSRGFTLIELMVTITIGVILMTLAVPSMRNMIERNAVSGHVNSFVGAVQLARSEAIKTGMPIVICISKNAEDDVPKCETSGSAWELGWIVFADKNANGKMDSSSSDILLRVQGKINDSGGIMQNKSSKLIFRPTGLMSSGLSQLTFNSKSLASKQQRRVCITMAGRTRIINNSTEVCDL